MEIERLKELKAEFEKVRKYNDMHCMSTVTEDDVLELIDEAITNQPVTKSATSEDVQRAIEQLKYAREQDREFDDGTFVDSLDLAIAALQAYQPTTRKDRTVEEVAIPKTETTSCEWCDRHTVVSWGGSRADSEECLHVNYCPNCGRKLKGDER